MNTDWRGAPGAMFDPDNLPGLGNGPAPTMTFPGTFGAGDAGVDLSQAFLDLTWAKQVTERTSFGIAAIIGMQVSEAKGVATFAGFTETFAASGGTALADARAFLDRIRERETSLGQVFAIALEDAFCGVISIAPEPRGDNLGYWLGEPYWGRGIMTEAGSAVVAEFFRQPQNEVLCSGIVCGNAASLAVQRKLGFKVVGESRIACVARGTEMPSMNTARMRLSSVPCTSVISSVATKPSGYSPAPVLVVWNAPGVVGKSAVPTWPPT